MKKVFFIIGLFLVFCISQAQDAPDPLKPNYCKIARVVKDASSHYFLDSLVERFSRYDTAMTVDDFRCLYYGGGEVSINNRWKHYQLLAGRFGRQNAKANDAWWQYQMLLTAVWSSGNGSKRKPLHVTSYDDALRMAADFGSPLWFKIKGKRKFNVAPQR